MPFPLDPNAPVFSPREPHATPDPAAPQTPEVLVTKLQAHAKRRTIREQLAAMQHRGRRDPRAFLADLEPNLTPATIAGWEDHEIRDLTELSIRGLMC